MTSAIDTSALFSAVKEIESAQAAQRWIAGNDGNGVEWLYGDISDRAGGGIVHYTPSRGAHEDGVNNAQAAVAEAIRQNARLIVKDVIDNLNTKIAENRGIIRQLIGVDF